MRVKAALLSTVLREPEGLAGLSLAAWDILLPQARRAGLVARLAWITESRGFEIPSGPREYLDGARAQAARQNQALHYEIQRIQAALDGIDAPVILLKGAAYAMAGLPPAQGRMFSDIDVLVPIHALDAIETALRYFGWASAHQSPYDQRYYRKWMHEVPPLQHVKRQSVIDLHHAILPLTARLNTNPAPLFTAARALAALPRFLVLAPADMVLHSATHLFHEGEFDRGLRDLVDLDALFRHFATAPDFWDELAQRARQLNLDRPLFYAMRYCRAVLRTPTPESMDGFGRPPLPRAMDALFGRALAPNHPSCDDALSTLARKLLYVRGHWLRMPLHLLIPHLAHKAFVRDEA